MLAFFVFRTSRPTSPPGAALPGRHLVVLEDECVYDSWIFLYNDANIDASRIVWARKLSGPEDAELRNYYSDRAQWRLSQVDGKFVLRAFH